MSEPSPDHDLQSCRQLMRGGSRTFYAASLLLPPRVREPASALYAFCRLADDAIDLGVDKHAAMEDLQQRLDAIYCGRPKPIDADRALTRVVHRFAIPRALLNGLLDGFLWDAQGRRYTTLAELESYGARVAGTVGAMMALLMQTRDASAVARACELGVAMQLTNIARDIGEDARHGRLYLPLEWLADAGICANDWMRAPEFNPAIAAVTQRLIARANALYQRSESGISALPRDCRIAIHAARLVYAEIGHQLERTGLDSINQRAVVSDRRKLTLIARASTAAIFGRTTGSARIAPLPAIQFLVDAAAARDLPAGSFYQRTLRVLDLFERVELRKRETLVRQAA